MSGTNVRRGCEKQPTAFLQSAFYIGTYKSERRMRFVRSLPSRE